MEDLGHGVLTLAQVVTVVAFVMAFAEDAGRRTFKARWYRVGPRVFRETRTLPLPPEGMLETQNGVLRSIAPNRGLFRHRGSPLTLMSVKGSITWTGDEAVIEGRTSLCVSLAASTYVFAQALEMLLSQVPTHGVAALGGVAFLTGSAAAIMGLLLSLGVAAGKRQSRLALAEIEASLTQSVGLTSASS